MALALVFIFALRGLIRGTVVQVFALLGMLSGLWAAGWVSQWVGAHWQGARPAAVFLVLRWLVAGLAGLALASLFGWWGELLGKAAKESPLGWMDRVGGGAVGAALGLVVVSVLLMVVLLLPGPRDLVEGAARGVMAPTLMRGGERACAWAGPFFPGSQWLGDRFESARRRATRIRSVAVTRPHAPGEWDFLSSDDAVVEPGALSLATGCAARDRAVRPNI